MSKIRSEWTLQEYKVHDFLGEEKIKHKMHPKIYGRPDIILNKNLIVFLDGCFWHGCAKHCRLPETRKEYWENKIRKNKKRDIYVTKKLKENNYNVIRIWEHDLKKKDNKKKFLNRLGLKNIEMHEVQK